jgi:hypothetical protein
MQINNLKYQKMGNIKLRNIINETSLTSKVKIIFDDWNGLLYVDEVPLTSEDIEYMKDIVTAFFNVKMTNNNQFDYTLETNLYIRDKVNGGEINLNMQDIIRIVNYSKKINVSSREDFN